MATINTQPAGDRVFGWQALGLWVAVTTAGFIVAGDLHFQMTGPTVPLDPQDIDPGAVLMGFVFGSVSGLVISSLQWLVLKAYAPTARLWIPVNIVGFGLAHALNDAVPYRPFDLPYVLAIGGVMLGLVQSIALRGAGSMSIIWLPIAAGAWVAGLLLGSAWLSLIDKDPIAEIAAVFGTAGLMIGAATGVALMFLLRRRATAMR
ncbi:MAG TPA: hypothetical protein PLG23_16855 [Thermoflexales bacterium]|jgi:hypothetical protein|nr:hypothetical protein [Anaerolineae bacterium]HQZ55136.1 hypothetical protein [Thermoflexales bacterium]